MIARQTRVEIDDSGVAAGAAADDGTRESAVVSIGLDIDAHAAIEAQAQHVLQLAVASDPLVASRRAGGVAQLARQTRKLTFEALALNLEVGCVLGDAELLAVELQDALGVLGRVVVAERHVVLVLERVQLARQALECAIVRAECGLARLLEGTQRGCDAVEGGAVRRDVEVVDTLLDELRQRMLVSACARVRG